MGWFNNLFGLLSGQEREVPPADHPQFGRIYASHRPRGGAWLWETLDQLPHRRGAVSVTWHADAQGPTEPQIKFWKWLQDHIEEVVEQARPLLTIDVQDWTEAPLPDDPWRELVWVGACLPADGAHQSEWDLSFDLQSEPNVMLTVTFRDGRPLFVTADD